MMDTETGRNQPREKISAIVVCYNEETKIAENLASLEWVDEIIVVDSYSQDRTPEIARKYTDKVISHKWEGYIRQKQYALSLTTHDWVLSLDADERCSKKLKTEIIDILSCPKCAEEGFWIPRKVYYINRWIRWMGWYPDPKIRFFKKQHAKWGGKDPHDRVIVEGKTGILHGDIYHLSFDSVADHLNTIERFTTIAALELFSQGYKTSYLELLFRPMFTFVKMYCIKLGFLDGIPGLIISGLSSYHVFNKYNKLREFSASKT